MAGVGSGKKGTIYLLGATSSTQFAANQVTTENAKLAKAVTIAVPAASYKAGAAAGSDIATIVTGGSENTIHAVEVYNVTDSAVAGVAAAGAKATLYMASKTDGTSLVSQPATSDCKVVAVANGKVALPLYAAPNADAAVTGLTLTPGAFYPVDIYNTTSSDIATSIASGTVETRWLRAKSATTFVNSADLSDAKITVDTSRAVTSYIEFF